MIPAARGAVPKETEGVGATDDETGRAAAANSGGSSGHTHAKSSARDDDDGLPKRDHGSVAATDGGEIFWHRQGSAELGGVSGCFAPCDKCCAGIIR